MKQAALPAAGSLAARFAGCGAVGVLAGCGWEPCRGHTAGGRSSIVTLFRKYRHGAVMPIYMENQRLPSFSVTGVLTLERNYRSRDPPACSVHWKAGLR
jgi:hypothetical protein